MCLSACHMRNNQPVVPSCRICGYPNSVSFSLSKFCRNPDRKPLAYFRRIIHTRAHVI